MPVCVSCQLGMGTVSRGEGGQRGAKLGFKRSRDVAGEARGVQKKKQPCKMLHPKGLTPMRERFLYTVSQPCAHPRFFPSYTHP